MELDELKAGWNVLSDRLQQQEILNKRIIREMISNRTHSARSSMLRFDLRGCVVGLIALIAVPFLKPITTVTIPSLLLIEGVILFALLLQFYITSFIIRFQMDTMNLRQLTSLVLNYQLWMKRNVYINYALLILVIPAFLFLQQGAITHESWRYVLAVVIIIGTIYFSRFIYTHFYSRHIATIFKGLDELKEFEEE